jgi:hypothetical protein
MSRFAITVFLIFGLMLSGALSYTALMFLLGIWPL